MGASKKSRTIQTANLLENVQEDLEILFASTTEAVLLIEANGSIIIANHVSGHWLNRSAESLPGENSFQLFTQIGLPIRDWVHTAIRKQEIFESDASFNGRFMHFRLIPISDSGKVMRLIIIGQDITDQKQAEEQVREFTEQMDQKVRERTAQLEKLNKKLTEDRRRAEMLASLSQHLIQDSSDYSQLLGKFTENVSKLIGDTCFIALFTSNLTTVEIRAIAARDPKTMKRQRKNLLMQEFFVGTNEIVGKVLQGERFSANALSQEKINDLLTPELVTQLWKDGLVALEVFPLHAGDQSLGMLAISRSEGNPYTKDEISFISSLTSPVALAIQNALLFEQLSDSQKQLRGMSQQLVQMQESQFRHLAAELHDGIGQDLTAININLNIMRKLLPDSLSEEVISRIADSEELVQDIVKHIRSTMAEFRPPMLDEYGLSAAINWYCEQFQKRTNIKVNIDDRYMKNTRLPTETEIALFRISQEALNNVVQHAKASQVDIELFEDAGDCMMVINDNGIGINLDHHNLKSPGHWGLLIMQERARAIDGEFLIRSVPDQGTQIVVQVRKAK